MVMNKFLNDSGKRVLSEKRFNEEVEKLIGKVIPSRTHKKKSECMPQSWAAHKAFRDEWKGNNRELYLQRKKDDYLKNKERYAKNNKEWRLKNANEIKAKNKEKYWANRDEELKKVKAYREANREEVNARRRKRRSAMTAEEKHSEYLKQKIYREANKEKLKKKQQEYYENNRDAVIAKQKKYAQENPDKIKLQRKQRMVKDREGELAKKRASEKRRYATPIGKLSINMRTRMNLVLGRFLKDTKIASGVRDLGCSIEELKVHLESQFNSRMTWDNWGEYWHIDHIYPFAAIPDKNDRSQILAVCNWRNLQPLTATANLKKGDKVTPEAQELFNKLKKEFSKKQAG